MKRKWDLTIIGAATACALPFASGACAAATTAATHVAPPTAQPAAAAAGRAAIEGRQLEKVTLMLDWVPNTNHSGIFLARERGWFAEAGLEVQIIQPGEVMAQAAVVSGSADFGIDFQEQHTMARAEGLPLVSLAAIIQHNTSAFASLAAKGVESPADWEGLRYGSFGSPFEEPTLRALMACSGADPDRLAVVNAGLADPLALLASGQIDLSWIFYGWQGMQAELQGVDLDLVAMADHLDCVPDYYTPILVTSQDMIERQPATVRAFVGALARGYTEAIADPESAAKALLEASPELDAALVNSSQVWISARYQADAPRWGVQSREVWSTYAEWMVANGIIDEMIDVDAAFTNEFLP